MRQHAVLAFFNWSSNSDDDYSLVVKRDKYAAEEFNSAWRASVTELSICCIGRFFSRVRCLQLSSTYGKCGFSLV